MVYWNGDSITTPDPSRPATYISTGDYMFKDWTKFLPNTTDLFYANGSISFNQINQGGMGSCFWMAAASAVAEWPNLVKNIFLNHNKNTAGIFGISLFIRGKPYHLALDDNIMFYNSSSYDYAPIYA